MMVLMATGWTRQAHTGKSGGSEGHEQTPAFHWYLFSIHRRSGSSFQEIVLVSNRASISGRSRVLALDLRQEAPEQSCASSYKLALSVSEKAAVAKCRLTGSGCWEACVFSGFRPDIDGERRRRLRKGVSADLSCCRRRHPSIVTPSAKLPLHQGAASGSVACLWCSAGNNQTAWAVTMMRRRCADRTRTIRRLQAILVPGLA